MPQMTDAEIITIDEAIKHSYEVAGRKCDDCGKEHLQLAKWLEELKKNRDIITCQKAKIAELEAQNNDLFYKLNGVMLSVDKWLEGKELKQDEVNRAITMREKTLQIVEKLEAENEKNENIIRLADKTIEKQSAEIERLQKAGEEAITCFNRMESLYKIKCKELEVAKTEAYREFAERLKETNSTMDKRIISAERVDNLLKELTEKNDFKAGDKK